MVSGRINLQSNDGKVAGVVFEDGASSNVTVTVPKEGGVVATKAYADTKVSKTGDETIAGVKTFSNNAIMNGDVTLSGTGGLYIGTATTANKVAIKQSIGNSVGGIAITASNNSATCVISEIDDGSLIFRNNAIDTLKVFFGDTLHISPFGGLGYGTGAGGTVTQLTSKSTAVTLNKPCGQIITNSSALAGGSSVQFVVNNNTITSNDTVIITPEAGVDLARYRIDYTGGGGLFQIAITNIAATSYSDTLQFRFAVIKGVNS